MRIKGKNNDFYAFIVRKKRAQVFRREYENSLKSLYLFAQNLETLPCFRLDGKGIHVKPLYLHCICIIDDRCAAEHKPVPLAVSYFLFFKKMLNTKFHKRLENVIRCTRLWFIVVAIIVDCSIHINKITK